MIDARPLRAAAVVPTALDVQNQLERILASEDFRLSKRARRFLRFVVQETLAGRSRYLKAYTIAESVFAKPNFDAQNDPAVRIEARRIRSELERFYLKSRDFEPVLITIPKGGYVPSFIMNTAPCRRQGHPPGPVMSASRRTGLSNYLRQPVLFWVGAAGLSVAVAALLLAHAPSLAETSAEPLEEQLKPTVIVEPFYAAGGAEARFLRDQIIVRLVAGGKISVIVQSAGPDHLQGQHYLLQAGTRGAQGPMRLTARLVREGDGVVLWSRSYDLNARSSASTESESALASDVARDVAATLQASNS
ncbi:hypothetical protein ACK9YZ_30910 [Rhizobium sp. ZK1]|uniref:hypothetical protein n=1 Tax=Rhizobium sp. ZK1 TaxID=3389872 RepID=UPI0039F69A4F